jgi:non-specific serine/threonine protein kinase
VGVTVWREQTFDTEDGRMESRSDGNLPAHLPSLIGRETAIEVVSSLLDAAESGPLTLTGVGGCGKTCLALRVAARARDSGAFPDGVWLAELAPLRDPSLVPSVVAASVGVAEQPGRPIRETLIGELKARSLLLVLDNCEHLVEASAALSDELLRKCPDVRILATSREPLRISAERVWQVPPLPTLDVTERVSADEMRRNPSVQLFVARAQAVESTLTMTETTSRSIAGICARLDGLPLAIELAAARARVLTPDQILFRLNDAFRLLVGGSRTAPARQQTLRATLDWSYLLLKSPEQELFEYLAVFAGGFDVESAEAMWAGSVAPTESDLLDILTGLVDRSLVMAQPLSSGMRYRLLEPVRQYAERRLIERGAWNAARKRHAEYFLTLTEQAEEGLKGAEALAWKARVELEHDNVRAALRRCLDVHEPEIPLRIATALRNFWMQFGYRSECRRWLETALSIEETAPPAVRANALQSAGVIAFQEGDLRGARLRCEQATTQWRMLKDQAGLASTLVYHGRTVASMARTQAEYLHGKALLEEGIALNRRMGTAWWTANGFHFLGWSEWEHAELELAAAALREAERILVQLGDTHAHSHLSSKLGAVLRDQGDLARAEQLLQQSLSEARAISCMGGMAEALYFLAGLNRQRGDRATAARQAAECVELQHRLGDKAWLLMGLELLGGAAGDHELADRAAALLGGTRTLRESFGLPMPPILRPQFERDVTTARAALGRERFAKAWAEGSSMTLDRAAEYARQTDFASPLTQASAVDPLSLRERQVIALLARGYSNRQIADELTISSRTADGHVAHILNKLGLATRAQAAVWAVEHRVNQSQA